MKDKDFQKLLDDTTKAHLKYRSLLDKAEEEYKRRFGFYPCEVDDDYWIDSFHESPIGATVEEVFKSAELRR